MTALTLPAQPWTHGQQTADGTRYFDSSVGSTGAWRSTPLPVGGLPAGSIIQWSSNTAPANWLICDGSAVSRSVYSSLFAVIGTTYGVGDGSTTFNLPDLRGRVPVGKNGGTFGTLGATGGAETHTLTTAQIPAHQHNIANNDGGGPYTFPAYSAMTGYTSTVSSTHNTLGMTSVGGGEAHNNLQPYLVVNYIIKATAGWTAGDSELATRVGVLEQNPNITGTLTVAGNATFNGKVISPNMPRFFGSRNDAGAPRASTPWPLTSVNVNVGNCYNSSTSLFTCPVAGYYEANFFGIGAVTQGELQIRRNNVTVAIGHWNHSGQTWDNVTVSALIYCSVNDTISFATTGDGVYAGAYNGASINFLG